MKCLVTGAAGFIGSHLVDRLLREGHEVRKVDLRIRGGINLVNHNLEPVVKDIDWVFHLAARTGLQPWSSFQEYLEDNVLGTQRLLEACHQYCPGLKRFVYASTSSVYGREAVGDERQPLKPVSPYGWTKMGGELLCLQYGLQDGYGVPTTVLRYFSVYGPRQREGMAIRKWIDAALRGEPMEVCWGSIHHTRSLTYVDDVVEATLLAAQRDEAVGEVFNIAGSPNGMSVVIGQIRETTGFSSDYVESLPPRGGDQINTRGDTSKARNLLGWEPKVDLITGIRRQVEWQRSLMEGK